MRQLRATGGRKMSLLYLAWMFETSVPNVHFIITGATHKDADGPVTPARVPLTEEQVLAIRYRRSEGIPYAQLSEEFGKSSVALRSICSGHSFPNFGGPLAKRSTA